MHLKKLKFYLQSFQAINFYRKLLLLGNEKESFALPLWQDFLVLVLDILGHATLCCRGTVLCIVRHLAAFWASTN